MSIPGRAGSVSQKGGPAFSKRQSGNHKHVHDAVVVSIGYHFSGAFRSHFYARPNVLPPRFAEVCGVCLVVS